MNWAKICKKANVGLQKKEFWDG